MATRGVTKWLNKARRISNTISDLKEEDRQKWTRDYYSDTRTGVGVRFQNLGEYLKTMRDRETTARRDDGLGETSIKQYRTMARARVARIDVIEAEELASRILQARERQREQQWRDPVWLAELARDLQQEHARIYEPGVEMRLMREELSIADIERVEDLRERARRYGARRLLAPQILDEILAEADAHRADALPVIPRTMREPHERDPHIYYSDDDLGGHVRKQKHKRTHKNKKSRSRKRKKSRKH